MLNNFVGEFLILQGAAQAHFIWSVFAALGVILSACYMLWMYQRVFFGTLGETVKHHMPDFSDREWVCIAPLIVMMVWMGIFTHTFLPGGLRYQRPHPRANRSCGSLASAVQTLAELRLAGGHLHAR